MADDFKAEVSNGFLLIAIKIPTVACASCGKVYTPTVNVEQVESYYRNSVPLGSAVACSPWNEEPEWGYVQLGKADNFKRALVCADCYAPIARIEAIVKTMKHQVNEVVGSTVKSWDE